MNKKIHQTAMNRSTLAAKYGVSYNTFRKWLLDIPNLELSPKSRLLTPRQLQLIYEELGEPNKDH